MKSRPAKARTFREQPAATPETSAAPFSAPADVPTTRSRASVSPAASIASVIALETTPRMPPPSRTSATRWPSSRARPAAAPPPLAQDVEDRMLGDLGHDRLSPQ